ncbi:hypothetical protein P691DRAFT_809434 [Macrolepiota fuliginosa MF-IS2]|uniref:Uncharacterized protein n=1 Tax=Macrolepiota fuliginosa MF-IS2 TaxID=1400762 RepID=A0A9P5X4L2_9AGAR|nr:hypothetical protein P691DRAFT_809434 [Macrolepiota fuliginosa MF-IS2]
MMFGWTAEQGSRQLIWAAGGTPKGDNDSPDKLKGVYVGLADIDEPSDFVLGDEGKEREDKLWADLISMFEKLNSRIKVVVAQHLTAPSTASSQMDSNRISGPSAWTLDYIFHYAFPLMYPDNFLYLPAIPYP